ncbi:MAG: response regulator transcription factor [Oscillospiraceae bacterium]
MRILVVEDEKRLAETLGALLTRQGYTADLCFDGESGLDSARSGIYDMMILDVMLPKKDGFAVLRELRGGGSSLPVLLLTAKSELSDKVYGLDCGADYYLTKPFEPRELLACVRALTRRQGTIRTEENLSFAGMTLDRAAFSLSVGERSARLSRKEFDIMELLMASRGQVVPKEQILLKVWGYESDAEDNNVEVYISFLRRKLSFLHAPAKIRTLRLVGYALEEET